MKGFFLRDSFEDVVVASVRKMNDVQLAALATQLYKVPCTVCDPREGDFVVDGIDKCPELKECIGT